MQVWKRILFLSSQWIFWVLCTGHVLLVRASLDDEDDEEYDDQPAAADIPKLQPGRFVKTMQDLQDTQHWTDQVTFEKFKLEVACLIGILVYVVLHMYGRRLNTSMAKAWMTSTLHVWKRHFHQVGTDQKHTLVRDGPGDYIFYASGRRHVKDVYGYLKLKPRHDPITWIYNTFMNVGMHDKVTLKFNMSGTHMDSFIFALLTRNKAASLTKQRFDLFEFTKSRESSLVPKRYVIQSDNTEFHPLLLNDPLFLKALYKSAGLDEQGQGTGFLQPLIESLIYTDQPAVKPLKIEHVRTCPKTLVVDIRFPDYSIFSSEFEDHLANTVQLVMDVIDCIGQYGKLSVQTGEKLKKMRDIAVASLLREAELERKEELQNLKIQEKKAREEAVSKLSPEEQRKWEEKERKKEAKKEMSKRMKRGKIVMR